MSDLFVFCTGKPSTRDALDDLRSRRNVGRALIGARLDQRLSQQEVATRAGTKQSRISEVESLNGNVQFDTLDRIARALGLEITLQPRGEDPPCACVECSPVLPSSSPSGEK